MTLPHGFGSRGSKEDRKKPREINMHLVGTVVLFSFLFIFLGYSMDYHNTNNYPIDQANNALYNAYETTHVSNKMMYIQEALNGIPESGNTAMIYPTTYYEWGDVRTVMQQVIAEGEELAILAKVDNMAYQQAIPNYNTSIDQLHDRVEYILRAQGYNVFLNPIGYAIVIAGIISIPVMIVIDQRLQKSFYEKARSSY